MNVTITLVQDEIHAAIKDFIGKHNIITEDKDIKIDLVASRGAAGFSAVIAINGDLLAEVESRLTPPAPEVPSTPVAREVTPPAAPATPAPDTKVIDELFGEEAPPVAEKKTRTRKATPATEAPPVQEAMPDPIHDSSDDDLPAGPTGPTPPVAAAVDKAVDDLFAAENNNLVEEVTPEVGSEDESLFN
jgi:hypothetical protein